MNNNTTFALCHYFTDICLRSPGDTMSRYENFWVFQGTAKEFAKKTHRRHPSDAWHEFEFGGSAWVFPQAKEYYPCNGLPEILDIRDDAVHRLYKALFEHDIEALKTALEDGANPDAIMISAFWYPLDFALPCGMEFVLVLLNAGARKMHTVDAEFDRCCNWELGLGNEAMAYVESLRQKRDLHRLHDLPMDKSASVL